MRDSYRCIYCGLVLHGRLGPNGRVYVYGKSPSANSTPKSCVCATCGAKKGRQC